MNLQLFLSAFMAGLLSSVHCVGMCGAIAFSLPTQHLPPPQKLRGILLYNAGRISIYALFGLIFGVLGRQIYIAGYQQQFSIVAGIVILIAVFQFLFPFKLHLPGFSFINGFIQKIIGSFLKQPKPGLMYWLGVANGFLPCGLIYLAITGSLAAGSVGGGILFMILFGLGTFPAMFSVSYFGYKVKLSVRRHIRKAVPFVMAVMGMLLILRGMNLGIPYVSPYVPPVQKTVVSCH